jgi:mitochondrial fission protein ELM1
LNDGSANIRQFIIWHISDGRRGHDNQCLGLVQALQQLRPCRYFKIDRSPLLGLTVAFLAGRYPPGDGLPDPDLVIAAGHHTHLSLLCANRARQGKTVVLMRPSLPTAWFDLCLIPAHDRQPAAADNVIQTSGALTRIRPTDRHDPNRGLILIGGPSRHHAWDQDSLLRQINRVADQSGLRWTVSDSPRTPDTTRRALSALHNTAVRYVSCAGQPASWLPGQLARAGSVWITEDSVSMIYDALTSGAAVGLLQVPHKHESRITRIADSLDKQRMVTLFSDWQAGQGLAPPAAVLNESERCARLLLQRLFP